MDIARILRRRREELEITQGELAQHCGFKTKASISLLESGHRQWKFENVWMACKLLKLELFIVKERTKWLNQKENC